VKKKTIGNRRTADKSGKHSFPMLIKRTGVEVKIYHRKDKGAYDSFSVAHYEHGQRVLKPFSTLDAAKEHAESVIKRLVRGEPEGRTLLAQDYLVFKRASSLVEPTGVPLDSAVSEYVRLLNLLDGRATLSEAVRSYVARNDKPRTDRMVADVVQELVKLRTDQNCSPDHYEDLERRLQRFSKSFQCNVADISPVEIERWLLALKKKPRSINNFHGALKNMFNFAKKRGYIERERRIMEDVPEVIEPQREIGVYDPEHLCELISHCSVKFLPYLVIAAFGGFRASEIDRLDWENIGPDEIKVPPSEYRVKSTRLVLINETLRHWMEVIRMPSGKLVVHKNVASTLLRLQTKAGVEPVHNGLRHSFASYSLAVTRNPDALAYEMGNSPAMLKKHYRRLVPLERAQAWFDLTPDKFDRSMTEW